jgi:hypothetical protein
MAAPPTYEPLPQRPTSPTYALDPSEDQAPLLSEEHEQDAGRAVPTVGLDFALPGRIRWINFVLGAAVLLPWNGKHCAPLNHELP